MSDLQISCNWMDGGKVQGEELRATWAAFRVKVDSCNLVECFDDYSQTVREEIFIPAYPVAEWFAMNWWRLWQETRSQLGSTPSPAHWFQAASEGFALPDIRFWASGSSLELEANSVQRPLAKLRFLNSGKFWLRTVQCEEEVARFVDSVCERLEHKGISNTFPQREWNAVREVESQEDADSIRFCRSAGRMGLDPFQMDTDVAAQIEDALQSLPISLQDDFFEVVTADSLGVRLKELKLALQGAQKSKPLPLGLMGSTPLPMAIGEPPWRIGYSLAREVRERLCLDDRSFHSVEELMDLSPLKAVGVFTESLNIPGMDALLTADSTHGYPIRCAIRGNLGTTRLFHAARAVGELFYSSEFTPALLTSSGQLERQKRSRAFAAEFLAPARLIQKAITGATLNQDAARVIAESFGVSDWVIREQVENQRIAQVVM